MHEAWLHFRLLSAHRRYLHTLKLIHTERHKTYFGLTLISSHTESSLIHNSQSEVFKYHWLSLALLPIYLIIAFSRRLLEIYLFIAILCSILHLMAFCKLSYTTELVSVQSRLPHLALNFVKELLYRIFQTSLTRRSPFAMNTYETSCTCQTSNFTADHKKLARNSWHL